MNFNGEFIFSEHKKSRLLDWLQLQHSEVYLLTPYFSKNVMIEIISKCTEIGTLVFKGDKADFLSRVVDISILKDLIQRGWKVRMNTNLHAKIVLSSNSCFFGSANLTNNGLLREPIGNFETWSYVENLPSSYLELIQTFIKSSKLLTLDDVHDIEKWVSEQKINETEFTREFPIVANSISLEGFSLLDLPQSNSLLDIVKNFETSSLTEMNYYDLKLLDLDESKIEYIKVKKAFLNLSLVREFLNFIEDGKRFGEFRRWLENHIEDVPTPSRDEFNVQLNRLYALIVEATDGDYIRFRPNHTEFLIKKDAKHKFFSGDDK